MKIWLTGSQRVAHSRYTLIILADDVILFYVTHRAKRYVMLSSVMQKSHTNSGYRLSIPLPLYCPVPSSLPFLTVFFFPYARLE